MKILELRVQALLVKGHYQTAQEEVEQWLARYEADSVPNGRFEADVR